MRRWIGVAMLCVAVSGCASDKLRAFEQLPHCMKLLATPEEVETANLLLRAKEGDTVVNVQCTRQAVRESIK